MAKMRSPDRTLRGAVALLTVFVVLGATVLLLAARPSLAAFPEAAAAIDPHLAGWAFMAAATSTALATLGAGYAVARVGSAAVGAIAEKPELFGRVLVLVGLAEGIAIYGLIVSILILDRVGR
ncbi:MAG TPA: ATP synthase subunit C [Steroidobacteraceae bacterium]|nr:ATP synthase subunit C [Steroidobacteraceae bacterium]